MIVYIHIHTHVAKRAHHLQLNPPSILFSPSVKPQIGGENRELRAAAMLQSHLCADAADSQL